MIRFSFSIIDDLLEGRFAVSGNAIQVDNRAWGGGNKPIHTSLFPFPLPGEQVQPARFCCGQVVSINCIECETHNRRIATGLFPLRCRRLASLCPGTGF